MRRYHRPPDALVRACRTRGLPLVTLSQDVNFLEVTQVVHTLILGNQTEAIHRTQRIHEAFTALALRGATLEEVLRTAAETSGHTIVLENLVHQAVICEPSGHTNVEDALADWERRSRSTPPSDHLAVRGPEGWLTTAVEYRGERWGRVAMLPGPSPVRPAFGPEDVTVLERTAMTLTIARLIHPTAWERGAHRNALRDLAEQRLRSPCEARARAAALGLPSQADRFLAVLVDTDTRAGAGAGAEERDGSELEGRLAQELTATASHGLVGELAPGRIGVLLALTPSKPWCPAVERLSRVALELRPRAVVSVGSETTDIAHTTRSFRDAARVAEATAPATSRSTNSPTSACRNCSTHCARTYASRNTWNDNSARSSITTPATAPTC